MSSSLPPLAASFTRIVYDRCLQNLSNGKSCGPDNIPNDILKALPGNFHDMIYLFFLQCYHKKEISSKWKHSIIIFLYKKDNPIIVTNYISVVLACTIYKLFTSTLTSILTTFGERHKILYHNQEEDFRPMRSTTRQIQAIIVTLEDVKFTNKDIYITYIDPKNAFGFINHSRLLAIMEDLGYPPNTIELVGNICAKWTTSFWCACITTTTPIQISCETIQREPILIYRLSRIPT